MLHLTTNEAVRKARDGISSHLGTSKVPIRWLARVADLHLEDLMAFLAGEPLHALPEKFVISALLCLPRAYAAFWPKDVVDAMVRALEVEPSVAAPPVIILNCRCCGKQFNGWVFSEALCRSGCGK